MQLFNNRTYSILFIGNSYTFRNDMPEAIFTPIAESVGYSVNVKMITKGGYTLAKHADPTDERGAEVERELSESGKYDIVILQENSTVPVADPDRFYNAVRELSSKIRAAGAPPILYSTWGRKTGSSTLDQYNLTSESMTWQLASAYCKAGSDLDIPVAYVGLAFRDVYTTNESIELYTDDRSHPSYAGSYLAAATLFAKIFGVDPTTVSYTGNLSSSEAAILLEAARKAVFETPLIPDNYQA